MKFVHGKILSVLSRFMNSTNISCVNSLKRSQYALKNKRASKGCSSDAIEEPFLVPQRTIQSKVL